MNIRSESEQSARMRLTYARSDLPSLSLHVFAFLPAPYTHHRRSTRILRVRNQTLDVLDVRTRTFRRLVDADECIRTQVAGARHCVPHARAIRSASCTILQGGGRRKRSERTCFGMCLPLSHSTRRPLLLLLVAAEHLLKEAELGQYPRTLEHQAEENRVEQHVMSCVLETVVSGRTVERRCGE